MRPLVFATCDITPDQWSLFLAPASRISNIDDTHVSYTLVTSPTQQHLGETRQLTNTVQSSFATATWEELKSAFTALSTPPDIEDYNFLLLDLDSFTSQTVTIIYRSVSTSPPTRADGNTIHVTTSVTWKKYTAPWDKAVDVQFGLEGLIDPPDEWFVGVLEEEEVVEEVSSEGEESEDSFDYEYEEGPPGTRG